MNKRDYFLTYARSEAQTPEQLQAHAQRLWRFGAGLNDANAVGIGEATANLEQLAGGLTGQLAVQVVLVSVLLDCAQTFDSNSQLHLAVLLDAVQQSMPASNHVEINTADNLSIQEPSEATAAVLENADNVIANANNAILDLIKEFFVERPVVHANFLDDMKSLLIDFFTRHPAALDPSRRPQTLSQLTFCLVVDIIEHIYELASVSEPHKNDSRVVAIADILKNPPWHTAAQKPTANGRDIHSGDIDHPMHGNASSTLDRVPSRSSTAAAAAATESNPHVPSSNKGSTMQNRLTDSQQPETHESDDAVLSSVSGTLEVFLNTLNTHTKWKEEKGTPAADSTKAAPYLYGDLIKPFMLCLAQAMLCHLKIMKSDQDPSKGFDMTIINQGLIAGRAPATMKDLYFQSITYEYSGQPRTITSLRKTLDIQRNEGITGKKSSAFAKTFTQAAIAFIKEDSLSLARRSAVCDWIDEVGGLSNADDKNKLESYQQVFRNLDKALKADTNKDIKHYVTKLSKILSGIYPEAATLIRIICIMCLDKLTEAEFRSFIADEESGEIEWLSGLDPKKLAQTAIPTNSKEACLSALAGYICQQADVKKYGFDALINAIVEFHPDDSARLHFGLCVEKYFSLDVSSTNPITLRTLELLEGNDCPALRQWLASLQEACRLTSSSIGELSQRLISIVLTKNLNNDAEYQYGDDVFADLTEQDQGGQELASLYAAFHKNYSKRKQYYDAFVVFFHLLCNRLSNKYRRASGYADDVTPFFIKLCAVVYDSARDFNSKTSAEIMYDAAYQLNSNSADQVCPDDSKELALRQLECDVEQLLVTLDEKLDAETIVFSSPLKNGVEIRTKQNIQKINSALYGVSNPKQHNFRHYFDDAKAQKKAEFFINMMFTLQYHPIDVVSGNPTDETTSKLCQEVAAVYAEDYEELKGMWQALAGLTKENNFYTHPETLKDLCNYYSSNADTNDLAKARRIAVFGFEDQHYAEHRHMFAVLILKVFLKTFSKAFEADVAARIIIIPTQLERRCFEKALKMLLDPSRILSADDCRRITSPEFEYTIRVMVNAGAARDTSDNLIVKAKQQPIMVAANLSQLVGEDIETARYAAHLQRHQVKKEAVIERLRASLVAASRPLEKRDFHSVANSFDGILTGLVHGAFPAEDPKALHPNTQLPIAYKYLKANGRTEWTFDELKTELFNEIVRLTQNLMKPIDSEILTSAISNLYTRIKPTYADHSLIAKGVSGPDYYRTFVEMKVFFEGATLAKVAGRAATRLNVIINNIVVTEQALVENPGAREEKEEEHGAAAPVPQETFKNAVVDVIPEIRKWLSGKPTRDNMPQELKQFINTDNLTAVKIAGLKMNWDAACKIDYFTLRLSYLEEARKLNYAKATERRNDCLNHVLQHGDEVFVAASAVEADESSSRLKNFIVQLKGYVATPNLSPAESKKRLGYLDDFIWTAVEYADESKDPRKYNDLLACGFDTAQLIVLGFRRFVAMNDKDRDNHGPSLLTILAKLAQKIYAANPNTEIDVFGIRKAEKRTIAAIKKSGGDKAVQQYYKQHPDANRQHYVIIQSQKALQAFPVFFNKLDADINNLATLLYYHTYRLAQIALCDKVEAEEKNRLVDYDDPVDDEEVVRTIPSQKLSETLLDALHRLLLKDTAFANWHRCMLNNSKESDSSLDALIRRQSEHPAAWNLEEAKNKKAEGLKQSINSDPYVWTSAYQTNGKFVPQYAAMSYDAEAHAIAELLRFLSDPSLLGTKEDEISLLYRPKDKSTQINSILKQQAFIFMVARWWYSPKKDKSKDEDKKYVPLRSPFVPAIVHIKRIEPEMLNNLLKRACDNFNETLLRQAREEKIAMALKQKKADEQNFQNGLASKLGYVNYINEALLEDMKVAIDDSSKVKAIYVKQTLAKLNENGLTGKVQAEFVLWLLRQEDNTPTPIVVQQKAASWWPFSMFSTSNNSQSSSGTHSALHNSEGSAHAADDDLVSSTGVVPKSGDETKNERKLLYKAFEWFYLYIQRGEKSFRREKDQRIGRLNYLLEKVGEYHLWDVYYSYIAELGDINSEMFIMNCEKMQFAKPGETQDIVRLHAKMILKNLSAHPCQDAAVYKKALHYCFCSLVMHAKDLVATLKEYGLQEKFREYLQELKTSSANTLGIMVFQKTDIYLKALIDSQGLMSIANEQAVLSDPKAYAKCSWLYTEIYGVCLLGTQKTELAQFGKAIGVHTETGLLSTNPAAIHQPALAIVAEATTTNPLIGNGVR